MPKYPKMVQWSNLTRNSPLQPEDFRSEYMNWGWGLATVIWIAFLMLGVAWKSKMLPGLGLTGWEKCHTVAFVQLYWVYQRGYGVQRKADKVKKAFFICQPIGVGFKRPWLKIGVPKGNRCPMAIERSKVSAIAISAGCHQVYLIQQNEPGCWDHAAKVMNIITGNFVSAAMERSQSVKAGIDLEMD